MSERPEWVCRDELGLYWPSLAGRMGETLALAGRGPEYIIGAKKKAWYLSADVDAWVLAEKKRQAEARASTVKIPRARKEPAEPQRRTKKRPTKMSRYLAERAEADRHH